MLQRIANINSAKFPAREFEIPSSEEIPIDATAHEWTNYYKSGLRGVTQLLKKKRGDFVSVGMDILCDGTVPSGGGMSSSAAFTCTSALAVLTANGENKVDKKELCELAIVSERSVGVNSGGYVFFQPEDWSLTTNTAWIRRLLFFHLGDQLYT